MTTLNGLPIAMSPGWFSPLKFLPTDGRPWNDAAERHTTEDGTLPSPWPLRKA